MKNPACWLGVLLLVATACSPDIKPGEHPLARSAVFPSANQEVAVRTEEPLFRPPPGHEPVANYPTPVFPSSAPAPRTTLSKVASHRPRYALVIGNRKYSSRELPNAANDANDMASALRRLNFDVTLQLDVTHEKMDTAVRSFQKKLDKNVVSLFYYAGHAVQHDGESYLIPIDALEQITAPGHLKYKAVNTAYVLDVMAHAGNGLNIVILDACRDNPLRGFSRSAARGLAPPPDAKGVLIAYSTAPGKTAEDGSGRNSPYTKHLLRYMTEPNLTIEAVLKHVMRAVEAETRERQVPWYASAMKHEFYFVE
jgi:uncharacterized caspase-like protein